MPSPTSPQYRAVSEKECLWNIESGAAGTPVLTGVYREPTIDCSWSPSRAVSRAAGYIGKMISRFGAQVTQQHADWTIQMEYRAEGLGAFASGIMFGNASEAVTGAADPWSHTFTPSVTTGRCNTLTIWMGLTGDSTHYLQFKWATITNIAYSITAEGSLMVTITGSSWFPTVVDRATLTVSKYVGSTANYNKTRTLGTQGTYTLYNSAGATYTNAILALDFSLSRPLEVLPNIAGTDPADLGTGELSLAVPNLSCVYDGIGAASIFKDYLDYKELGDATHKHSLSWTDANTTPHTFTITFWPAKWLDSTTLDFSNQIVKITGGLELYDDLPTANAAAGARTNPASLLITSSLSTAMTS